jgi:GntR family transcriptional repressor for pyruvate dehydrogenase complex
MHSTAREHEKIYEATASGAPEAARAAMRTHVENNRERRRRVHRALLNS